MVCIKNKIKKFQKKILICEATNLVTRHLKKNLSLKKLPLCLLHLYIFVSNYTERDGGTDRGRKKGSSW